MTVVDQQADHRISNHYWWLILILLTVLAGSIRLYQLDRPSFWVDELFTVRSSAALLRGHWSLSKALGYVPSAIGLKVSGVDISAISVKNAAQWRAMGVREYSHRMASCVIGILTIPLLGLACRRLVGDKAAILAMAILAVSVWHIQRSQDARYYSQQFLLFNLALIVYFRATEVRSQWRLVGAVLLGVAAIVTQPTALLIGLVLGGDWLISFLRREVVWLGRFGWAMIFVAGSFCVIAAAYNWFDMAEDTINNFHITSTVHSTITLVVAVAWMLGLPLVVASLISAVQLWRVKPRLSIYLALAAIAPIMTIAGISIFYRVGIRYAFVCQFAWILLAAIGLTRLYEILRSHVGRFMSVMPAMILIASLSVMTAIYIRDSNGFRPPWRDAFTYVADHRVEGEAIYTRHKLLGKYYLEDDSVEVLPLTQDELIAGEQNAWMVFIEDQLSGIFQQDRQWILGAAELKAVFGQHAGGRPLNLLVYYYDKDKHGQKSSSGASRSMSDSYQLVTSRLAWIF